MSTTIKLETPREGIFVGSYEWIIEEFKLRMSMDEMVESPVFEVKGKDLEGAEQTLHFQLSICLSSEHNARYKVFLRCISWGIFMIDSSINTQPDRYGGSNYRGFMTKKFNFLDKVQSFSQGTNSLDIYLIQGNLNLTCNLKVLRSYRQEKKSELQPQTIGEQLAEVLSNPEFSDATIICEERTFPCHKAILTARSDVFKAMFSHEGTSESKTGEVHIEDMEPEDVEELLRFIYTDVVDQATLNAPNLLAAADKYNLPKLKIFCAKALVGQLDFENAVEMLILSQLCFPPTT